MIVQSPNRRKDGQVDDKWTSKEKNDKGIIRQ
jgi:hypothetical protein